MKEEKRKAIEEAIQHASNLGFAFAVKWQTLDQVTEYKKMIVENLIEELEKP